MKKILLTLLLSVFSIINMSAHGIGFDVGWSQSLTSSGGINVGLLYEHRGVNFGFDILTDVTGRMPDKYYPTRCQVDLSGHARIGYTFKFGLGIGALIGGYRMAIEYLGDYYYNEVYRYGYYYPTYPYYAPYYNETIIVRRRKGSSYAYMRGFDAGLFVYYQFPLFNYNAIYLLGSVTCRTKMQTFTDGVNIGISVGFKFNVEN